MSSVPAHSADLSNRSVETRQLTHLSAAGATVVRDDLIAREEPLMVRVEGRSHAVLMRTPGHDVDLATGFLLTEGVITHAREIMEISACPSQGEAGTTVDVLLTDPAAFLAKPAATVSVRHPSCGLCGQQQLEEILKKHPALPIEDRWQPAAPQILSLPEKMRAEQSVFAQTGGVHACAFFDEAGQLLALREDVGRHNALDKLIGALLRQGRADGRRLSVVLSGRVSLEMVQKALAFRVPTMIAVSAPTSLAIDLAAASGVVLYGFTRADGCNAYTGAGR
jgi:FdhD protein